MDLQPTRTRAVFLRPFRAWPPSGAIKNEAPQRSKCMFCGTGSRKNIYLTASYSVASECREHCFRDLSIRIGYSLTVLNTVVDFLTVLKLPGHDFGNQHYQCQILGYINKFIEQANVVQID